MVLNSYFMDTPEQIKGNQSEKVDGRINPKYNSVGD